VPYPLSNVLLDSIPETDRKKLLRHLKPMPLPVKTSLYEPDDQPKYIHFLTSGIASIVTSMEDGGTTEVGTVGREGAPQGVHLLGPVPVSTRCFMQIAGTGLRMEYGSFERLFHEDETIRRPLLAYAQYQTVLLGQVAGCNRLHGMEEVIGSIPIRSTKQTQQLSGFAGKRDTLSIRWFSCCILLSTVYDIS